MAVLGDALPQGMGAPEADGVPAHMRHFEAGGQAAHPARHQAQAGGVAFVGSVQQQLQPQADAEEWAAAGDVVPQGSRQAAGLQGGHSRRAGADAGEYHAGGGVQRGGVAGYAGGYAGLGDGAGDAAEVAGFVVNDDDA